MNKNFSVKKLTVCNVDEEGRFGGPERRIIQIAKALHTYNVETVILYPKIDSDVFKNKIKESGVHGVSWPITRLSKEKKILFRYTLFFWFEILALLFFSRNGKSNLYTSTVLISSRLPLRPDWPVFQRSGI